MTTPPAAPGPPSPAAALLLSDLLRRPITDRGGASVGRLSDVIVRLRGADQPVVSGLVAAVGGGRSLSRSSRWPAWPSRAGRAPR